MSRRTQVLPAAALALALAAAALATPRAAEAYCPCYTASSASNQYGCAIDAHDGTNPTPNEWNAIFDLVSQGPSVWGDKGPSVGDIGQGCGKPEPLHSVPARFPCELLKGIAMQESGWRQFCVPDLPADQVGGSSRTIISFDCGYGVGQVTSGMHFGEDPDFDRDRVAYDATYNLATGTRILAEKWKATNCVGDNQPKIVEHWYTAAWAYNGLAYVNNPNNPNYNPNRGVWDPDAPDPGGAPYQEKVFGWIEHPPFADWKPTELAYPNPGDIGNDANQFPNQPPDLPEPDCASPTDCANQRAVHPTICDGDPGTGGGGGAGGSGQGGAGQGGSDAASAGPAGVGGSGPGGGGNTSGSGVNPTAGDGDDAGGCGCRAVAFEGTPAGLWAPALAMAALSLSRRSARRRRRSGR